MSKFNVSEIFQFAIKIEENGEKFYRKMVDKFDNKLINKLFQYLADEEKKHQETFSIILNQFEQYKPSESYPDEYFLYLKSYADNTIFNENKINTDIEKINSLAQALDFAIQKEIDSILYYQEIKGTVPESQHDKIDKIVEQERKHFMELTKIKKEF